MPWSRKTYLVLLVLAIALVAEVVIAYLYVFKPPIKIGVIHSETGSFCELEIPMIEAIELAVSEINATYKSRPLGRKLVIVRKNVDGRDKPGLQNAARDLIRNEGVDVIFGCLTSSCRKYVQEVVEEEDHLFYYSMQYEGLESSKNTVYVGAVPNQQVIPALERALGMSERKDIFLVGSDYVYSHVTNEIIREKVEYWGGRVLAEKYKPLDHHDFQSIVDDIASLKPVAIFNTLNGTSNRHFFEALRAHGDEALRNIPTYSFSIPEDSLHLFEGVPLADDYLVWGYFQSLENESNQKFIDSLKNEVAHTGRIGSPMVMSYSAVYLWSKAVENADNSSASKVKDHVANVSIMSPAGMLYVDEGSNHTWKVMRIGKVKPDGTIENKWSSSTPVKPVNYPKTQKYSDRQAWEKYLKTLYESWNESWVGSSANETPSESNCPKVV